MTVDGPILLLPPVAFVAFLAVAALIWLWSRGLAAGSRPTEEKVLPYACGEDLEWGALQPNFKQFFSVAVLFTVLHVAVLVVATLPNGPAVALGLVYLVIMVFATAALLAEFTTV